MQALDVVTMIYILCLTNFAVVNCQFPTPDGYVSFMKDKVQAIAMNATTNYGQACDLITNCNAQNCSRQDCDESASNMNDGTNFEVQVDFGGSYIRNPVFGSSSDDVGQSICIQRELDHVFQAISDNITKSTTSLNFDLYFGGIEGVLRYYSGDRSQFCNSTYDPRVQPWFTGAISVQKDIVVLIDTGPNMANQDFFQDGHTALAIGKNLTIELLQTLVSGDRFTLVPFNRSAITSFDGRQASIQPSSSLTPEYLNSLLNNAAFEEVKDSETADASNFSAGFQEALKVFNNNSDPKSLKIVMLITHIDDTNSAAPLDFLNASTDFFQTGPKLFIYDVGTTSPDVHDWVHLACGVGGYFEQPDRALTLANPLLSLKSYFSFLSRSRVWANNNSSVPFWQLQQDDASGQGSVFTVSFPAMFTTAMSGTMVQELIGVAAIKFRGGSLQNQTISVLKTSYNLTSISPYLNGTVQLPCQANTGLPNCSTPTDFQPVCDAAVTGSDILSKRDYAPLSICLAGGFVFLFLLPILLINGCPQKYWRKYIKQTPPADPDSWPQMHLLSNFAYSELKEATKNFSTEREIGRGRYGTVYRAILREGSITEEMVAVKRLRQPADKAKDFQRERLVMSRYLTHVNIVQLKGICFHPTECFLVYELAERGDLSTWLWPEEQESGEDKMFLGWEQRIQIAEGVASGLRYLHQGLPFGRVYHLDIKPQNILLDKNFNPKIADFGISRFHELGYTSNVTHVNAGTPGYVAPELYEASTVPNSKLDSYSYGMVLLQLFCGRKLEDVEDSPSLRQWAVRREWEDEHAYEERLVDPQLIKSVEPEFADSLRAICMQLLNLALLCLSEVRGRPDMDSILAIFKELPRVLTFKRPVDIEKENMLSTQHTSTSRDLTRPSDFSACTGDHSRKFFLFCGKHQGCSL